MILLLLQSYFFLFRIEVLTRFSDFRSLYALVRDRQIKEPGQKKERDWSQICHVIDLACVLYGRRVLCLQRSAATVLLLRRNGFRAELVIGAQLLPSKSHAWVEIDGHVVNDRPYVGEIYRVLDRC